MSKVDMSRRVGVLMSTKAVLALNNDNRQAFITAVGQAESMTDLNSEFAGVIEAAEKELMAKGYVRDGKGRLLPPGAMAEQGHKEAKGPIIVALKGSSKSGNYGHAGIPGHQGGSAPKGKGGTGGAANMPPVSNSVVEGLKKNMAQGFGPTPTPKTTAAPDIKAQKRDLQKQLADLQNQIVMASGNETARLHREITATQKKLDALGKAAKPATKPATAPAKAPAQPKVEGLRSTTNKDKHFWFETGAQAVTVYDVSSRFPKARAGATYAHDGSKTSIADAKAKAKEDIANSIKRENENAKQVARRLRQ